MNQTHQRKTGFEPTPDCAFGNVSRGAAHVMDLRLTLAKNRRSDACRRAGGDLQLGQGKSSIAPRRASGSRATPGLSAAAVTPASGNKQSARVGPSMVAALVNSPSTFGPARLTRFPEVYPTTALALQRARFRRSRRSPHPGGDQRSSRFFALIESDVHSRKRCVRSRFEARRPHLPPHRQAFVLPSSE